MRTLHSILLLSLFGSSAWAQDAATDSTGLPGDHFSLQGALDLFKDSKDLESFEKALNTADRKVNNLDLDGDGEVDYIRVMDNKDGDAHAIVMQVPVGKDEFQDVAAIELERTADRTARLQIRGSEELYGPDVIVEPVAEGEDGKGPRGPAAPVDASVAWVWVNVWSWPCVAWVYGPGYMVWDSPYYYGYYPRWWRPWRPHPYRAYWGWHNHYHGWYHYTTTCHVPRAHAVYGPRATHSPRIRTATAPVRAQRAAMRPQPNRSGVRYLEGDRQRPAVREPQRPVTRGQQGTRPAARPTERGVEQGGRKKPMVREQPRTRPARTAPAPRQNRNSQRSAPAPRPSRNTGRP